jgi:hypothetical protein
MAWALHYGIHILQVFDASSQLKPTRSRNLNRGLLHPAHSVPKARAETSYCGTLTSMWSLKQERMPQRAAAEQCSQKEQAA